MSTDESVQKWTRVFSSFFRRVRATSMTQRRVEIRRVHFWTFSPMSVETRFLKVTVRVGTTLRILSLDLYMINIEQWSKIFCVAQVKDELGQKFIFVPTATVASLLVLFNIRLIIFEPPICLGVPIRTSHSILNRNFCPNSYLLKIQILRIISDSK